MLSCQERKLQLLYWRSSSVCLSLSLRQYVEAVSRCSKGTRRTAAEQNHRNVCAVLFLSQPHRHPKEWCGVGDAGVLCSALPCHALPCPAPYCLCWELVWCVPIVYMKEHDKKRPSTYLGCVVYKEILDNVRLCMYKVRTLTYLT